MKRDQRFDWMLCILVVVLTGCGTVPTGRFQAFRGASEDVYATTTDTFNRIEKRQRDFIVLTAPNKALTPDSFKPVVHGMGFDIRPELEYREGVLNVLVKYAKALESLAGKDFVSGVDKSAQELSGSLRGLGGGASGATISNAFGTVADLIGRELTDWMRKDSLKKAMDAGQPGVDALIPLLQRSNAGISRFVDQIRDRYIEHAQAGPRPTYGTWTRYKYDLEIAETLEEIEQIKNALSAATEALGKLPQAHRQIRESLDNQAQSLDQLHQIVQDAQRLRGFYRNLPAK